MKTGIKKDKSTEEKALFWHSIEQSACERESWPAWKRGFLSQTNVTGTQIPSSVKDKDSTGPSPTSSGAKRHGR